MSKVQSFLRQPRVQETLSRVNSLAEQLHLREAASKAQSLLQQLRVQEALGRVSSSDEQLHLRETLGKVPTLVREWRLPERLGGLYAGSFKPHLERLGRPKHRDTIVDLDRPLADRGRDAHHWAPPAQNRTCGFPAYGSHLGCLTANRALGQG